MTIGNRVTAKDRQGIKAECDRRAFWRPPICGGPVGKDIVFDAQWVIREQADGTYHYELAMESAGTKEAREQKPPRDPRDLPFTSSGVNEDAGGPRNIPKTSKPGVNGGADNF